MTAKDVNKLIGYWAATSDEDLQVARNLFRSRKYAYCLFFCHLAIEKILKALVVAKMRGHAPWTHNLPFLAGKADVSLAKDALDFLAEMTRWNLEARYPADLDNLKKIATRGLVRTRLKKTETFLKWSRNLLPGKF